MKILVLGIGNILFGDEGIGVHFCNYIDEKYEFSGAPSLDIIDGGTAAMRLIPLISSYDLVLMIDCVSVKNAKIGDVFFFDFERALEAASWQGSAHEFEMLQTLQMMDMFGDRPPIWILGVVPFVIGENTTFDLTDEILNASKTMEKTLLEFLSKQNISYKIKNNSLNLQEVARLSYKRNS